MNQHYYTNTGKDILLYSYTGGVINDLIEISSKLLIYRLCFHAPTATPKRNH